MGVLLSVLVLSALAYLLLGDGKLADIWSSVTKNDAVTALEKGRMYAEGGEFPQDWTQAAIWYRKAAEEGDSRGAYQLGLLFEEGKGVPQNWEQAAEWYRKAAEQGYANAEYRLGLCHRDGHGVGQDAIWAKIWLEKAARNGQVEAQEALARMAAGAEGGDPATVDLVSAEKGDATTQCLMGTRFMEGNGVEKDETTGVEWYRKAAEQGHAEAQYRLANCLRTGQGVEKDVQEAERWYRRSAEQGFAMAQRELGKCRMAVGDRKEALSWLEKSAKGGDAEGQYLLAVCFQKGLGTVKNPEKAKHWLEQASRNGHARAQSILKPQERKSNGKAGDGVGTRVRSGGPSEPCKVGQQLLQAGQQEAGVACLKAAAESGKTEAAILLGQYYHGKNAQQEYYWWHRAADLGSVAAQWQMVDLCRGGVGTSASDTEALRWAKKVAESGDRRAMRLVAQSYEKGVGCPQDYEQARAWYARTGNQEEVERMDRLIKQQNNKTYKKYPYHKREPDVRIHPGRIRHVRHVY